MEAPGARAGFAPVRMSRFRPALPLLALLAAACSSSATANSAASPVVTSVVEAESPDAALGPDPPSEIISIPLSLYILTDATDPASALSSQRSTTEVEAIAAGIQMIWQPAGVAFGPIHVESVAVAPEILAAIAQSRDLDVFFDQVGRTFDVPEPGLINGFYVAGAAGVNGFTPIGSTVFFVVDEPSVHGERVSSHEIGHILGLRHTPDDAGRLMFSGTNGMTLTGQEEEVARYGAEGLVDGTP